MTSKIILFFQYLLDTNVLIDMFKGNQRVQERIFRAHSRAEGFTLVTHNLRHFERFEGLRTEDWDRM